MKHCYLYFTAKPLSFESLVLKLCPNAFGQSDCRILQSALSQEKSERQSRFFECKLTQRFPTRKYYCAGMGDQACLKCLKQVCNILLISSCRISSCRLQFQVVEFQILGKNR